jgi:hypothetical protein
MITPSVRLFLSGAVMPSIALSPQPVTGLLLGSCAILLDVHVVIMWLDLTGKRMHASLWMTGIPGLVVPEDLLHPEAPREFCVIRSQALHYPVAPSTFRIIFRIKVVIDRAPLAMTAHLSSLGQSRVVDFMFSSSEVILQVFI